MATTTLQINTPEPYALPCDLSTYIALFFDPTGIVLASGTSPNSPIGRFAAVYSANSLIWPCDVRLLARKK